MVALILLTMDPQVVGLVVEVVAEYQDPLAARAEQLDRDMQAAMATQHNGQEEAGVGPVAQAATVLVVLVAMAALAFQVVYPALTHIMPAVVVVVVIRLYQRLLQAASAAAEADGQLVITLQTITAL